MKIPTYKDIESAHNRICDYVHRTPVMTSASINRMLESDLFFKCENFQKAGAFKYRGATNAVFSLTDDEAQKGVATHSSGNHAAALALAALKRGIKCFVVMPGNVKIPKLNAVKEYQADITFCEATLESREATLNEVVRKTGAVFIHPYNNFQVICGQGTAAKELLEDIEEIECILTPVGGGGLLSGTAISAKAFKPLIKVYGCEPRQADDAFRSFHSGILMPSVNPSTIADGLLTSLGPMTFEIIRHKVDDILTVSEKSIIDAMQLIWQRMKIIIEPSSAVTLAAIIEYPEYFRGKKTGIILSGGNVDLLNLPFGKM